MRLTPYLFALCFTFQNCSSPKVVRFVNDELDFSQYQTFRLINYKSDDKSYDAEGLAFFTHVEEAIVQNMTGKGYEKAPKADLTARYEIVSTTITETNRNYDPYRYNRSLYYPTSNPWNDIKRTEAVILIELRDRKQKKLVWQGSLDLRYSKKTDPKVTLTESIDRIFTTYPYQAGSNEPVISK